MVWSLKKINMPIVTNLWPDKNGKPAHPVELMDNGHIRSAHKLCWYRIFIGDDPEKTGDKESLAKAYGIFVTKEQAEKWIPIFKKEAQKRKIILHKPDDVNYKTWLLQRQGKKMYYKQSFDKTISYDQKTNDYGGKHI